MIRGSTYANILILSVGEMGPEWKITSLIFTLTGLDPTRDENPGRLCFHHASQTTIKGDIKLYQENE